MKKYLFKLFFSFLVADFFVLFLVNSILFGAEKKGSVTGAVRYFGTSPPCESAPVKVDPVVFSPPVFQNIEGYSKWHSIIFK